jgi:hypothetical protein
MENIIEFEVMSSQTELEEFEHTTIYKDFINELAIRIAHLKAGLMDDELVLSGRQYDVFRGGIKNMEQMKEIFRDLAGGKASQDNAACNQ